MDPALNPFAPTAGRQPPELAGRQTLLDDARIALIRTAAGRHARNIVLYGLRGVGKTVLLNQFEKIAFDLGHSAILIEAPERRELPELLVPPLRNLLLRLDRLEGATAKVRRAATALSNFARGFKVTLGDITVEYGGDPRGISDSGALDIDLSDLFVAVAEAAQVKHHCVVLLVDEIQYLSETSFAAVISAMHKISQRELPMLFLGAGLPQVLALAGNAKSYAERLFSFVEVGPLQQNDARIALQTPIREAGAEIDAEAITVVHEETRGYPFFIQEWGAQCWNIAPSSPIRGDDARAASKPAIAQLDQSFFRMRFDRCTPREKDYLFAMAALGPGPHRSGDIATRLGKGVTVIGPLRAGLIKKGMVYSPAHGDTAFTVPLFDQYLLRLQEKVQ